MRAGGLTLNTTGSPAVSGNLLVSGGTATLAQSNQVATGGTVAVSSGTLAMQGFSNTVTGVQITGGAITGTGGILTSTTAFDVRAGSVSAILGGTVGLNKTTGSTATLTGANTYTGATSITNGILSISATGNLGDASGTNTISIDGGTLQNTGTGVNLGVTRTVAIGGSGATVDVTAANDLTISGDVGGSGNMLTKTGSGTLNLNGLQTYGTLKTNDGTTNVNSAFTNGTVDANATTNFTVSQTLAALNIGTVPLAGLGAEPAFTGGGAAVVPEPGSAVSLLGGLSMLLGLQRFRRRA